MSAPLPVGLMALGGFATGCGMRMLDPLLPIDATFPPGSVTGAPKVAALEHIETLETAATRRRYGICLPTTRCFTRR